MTKRTGTIGILNVGAGDTKLVFDNKNPIESARAARIVRDMLRHGYVLFIETDIKGKKIYQRARDFDEKTCEYIIADIEEVKQKTPDSKQPKLKRVSAKTTTGVAVARSAGG